MKLNRVVFLSMIVASVVAQANAQWTQANGPYSGGKTGFFAVSGTNLFAGTDGGGVFLSTNNGTSWSPMNTGLTQLYVWALAFSGTNLFAGTRAASLCPRTTGRAGVSPPAWGPKASRRLQFPARISLPGLMAVLFCPLITGQVGSPSKQA